MAQRHHYAAHRWLGAVAALQLLAWSLSGLIFGLHDIDHVRGEHGRAAPAAASLPVEGVRLTVGDAMSHAGITAIDTAELRAHLDRVVYELTPTEGPTTLVDARDGRVLSPIDEATARAIARADRAAATEIRRASWVTADAPVEYRGRPLPAWRVDLVDDEGTSLWVDGRSGRIRARRNDAWRRFDFFWMLHTMDYEERDDFNHLALVIFALSSLATVLSGLSLWFLRLRRRLGRRRGRMVAAADDRGAEGSG